MAFWKIEKEIIYNLEYFMVKELALNRYFQDKLRVFKKVFKSTRPISFSFHSSRLPTTVCSLCFLARRAPKGFIGVFILC